VSSLSTLAPERESPPAKEDRPGPGSGRRETGSLATAGLLSVPVTAAAANALAAVPWLRGIAIPGTAPLLLGGAAASVLPAFLVGQVGRRRAAASYAVSAVALLVLAVSALGRHRRPWPRGWRVGPPAS